MKPFILRVLCLLTLLAVSPTLADAQENLKGLMPEIKLNSDNEEINQEKAFKSEILITKSENKAIETLIKILKKNKNPGEEVDLLFRLAELYMRRAKSGRFFDLDQRSDSKLKLYGLNSQKAYDSLRQALKVYSQITNRFPSYKDLDFVLFNSALAHLQLKEVEKAKSFYLQLITRYPNSSLIPDALLEVGEIYYNQQKFSAALEHFKNLEKYPKSRAYPYGLYKSAWCYYNLKNTNEGINQLLAVVKQNPAPKNTSELNPADVKDDRRYNLRREALRDLTLFVGETLAPDEVFGFFRAITTEDELGEIILALAGLYESHSRFKEISVFTRQYIEHYPLSQQTPKCYIKLIETNEVLKQRPIVIENLSAMAKFCKQDKVASSCLEDFRKVSLDIAKKWWEIWLKNKNHMEFSNLTEKAFENLLSTDTPTQPDSKSRYAFAELLFQQAKFTQASQNYEKVSLHPNIDKTLAHDSLYGAIFSTEKIIEKDSENTVAIEKQKNLGLRYLKEFSMDEHVNEIQYKLGFIAYKQSDYDLALKYIKPLLTKNISESIRLKSEDSVLDIYNIKKDYLAIQNVAKDIVKKTIDANRKISMKKIIEEASYSQLQKEAKDLPLLKQVDLLIAFAKSHGDTKLGQDAYWQSISLVYAKGYDVLGANLSLAYIKQYPDDKRKLDALKEAAKAFLDSGDVNSAISTLKSLAIVDKDNFLKHQELICDLHKLNMQLDVTKKCYKDLYTRVDTIKKSALLVKLMQILNSQQFAKQNSQQADLQSSNEIQELQNQILTANIEPFATEILISRARKLLLQKNYPEAFNLSLKINARPVDADTRAEARLIQAEILEIEFMSQSVKAQESKFALVISMKTEKLDKAFTAYSSAIKMSKSDKIQLRGLQGIDRLYTHFIESITKMPLPETLNLTDKVNLKNELVKLTTPFVDKKRATVEQIKKITKLSSAQSRPIVWSEHSIESTVTPQIKYPDSKKFSLYYPADLSAANIKKLLENKKFFEAEKLALQLTATSEDRWIGLYYLSLVAEANKEYDKSLWLLEKASEKINEKSAEKSTQKTNTDNKNGENYLDLINYQKAKVLYSVEDFNSAFSFFEKVLDMKKTAPEIVVIYAIKFFSDGDYLKANEEFSRLSPKQIYTYGVDLLHIDSILLSGDLLLAQKLVDSYAQYKSEKSNKSSDRVEFLLEQARIQEAYVYNKEAALQFYQKALNKSSNPDQQVWLKKKIQFLNVNKNSQATSNMDRK